MGVSEALRSQLAGVDGTEAEIVGLSKTVLGLEPSEQEAFVDEWFQQVEEDASKRLLFVYVANDLVQRGMAKRATGMVRKFSKVLPKAMRLMSDSEMRVKVLRVLGIWEERGIYSKAFIKSLKKELQKASGSSTLYMSDDEEDWEHPKTQERGEDVEDFDDFDEDDEAVARLARMDSTASISDVALPRILTVAKAQTSKSKAFHQEICKAIETELDAVSTHMEKGGSLEQSFLNSLDDRLLTEKLDLLQGLIRSSKVLTKSLKDSATLENGFLLALESHVDIVGQKTQVNDARLAKCEDLRKRLDRLHAAHPESEAIQTTIQVKKRVLKHKPEAEQARKRKRSSDSESESESESSSGDEEDLDADDQQGDNGNQQGQQEGASGETSVFALKKRKRRKKKKNKKKDTDADADASTPMMYNKILNRYVPVPKMGEEEGWRDH